MMTQIGYDDNAKKCPVVDDLWWVQEAALHKYEQVAGTQLCVVHIVKTGVASHLLSMVRWYRRTWEML
jgi:hypothetical protein